MSSAISDTTGFRYGIQRVCAVWEQTRSTFYGRRSRLSSNGRPSGSRGPKPVVPDGELLDHVRAYIRNSPFCGEGHRKVWAHIRFGLDLPVGRNRVLRIMRENRLLSPYRARPAPPIEHEGTIVTEAPSVMWGTDATKIFTIDDGWVWAFIAVEHWNAECVGWHVAKRGDRFAALEPISQGVQKILGSTGKGVARGLSLRMDNGSQYLSDHFINQIRFWGIEPSFAFVRQPETNGVAERFNRMLKEQAIHGHWFRNVHEVREAVQKFVNLYNSKWRIEKNGFLSPLEARNRWELKHQRQAA